MRVDDEERGAQAFSSLCVGDRFSAKILCPRLFNSRRFIALSAWIFIRPYSRMCSSAWLERLHENEAHSTFRGHFSIIPRTRVHKRTKKMRQTLRRFQGPACQNVILLKI